MGKINVLEPSVFNKISAGEVVERPASIVKELIENSIDAGATKITLEITSGGIASIVVTDNGSGVHADDLSKAFMPHATSKIKLATDLDNILTLGFRGEALASIAAVTQVEMISKRKDSVLANFISLEGGVCLDSGEKGATDGTKIIVNNLFFNTPVRAKFLKKPKQEENEITNLMTRMILANPNISIKYIADGKTIYNSQGTGLSDAIFAVYGASTLQNLIPVEYSNNKYKLTGFSSKTTYFKPNRTYQTLIINGRYVNNYLISQAVSRAYEQYMMKQSFPFFVLNLEMPVQELDVNVNPNKLDVRFEDSQAIFAFVYNALNDSIKYNMMPKTDEASTDAPASTQDIETQIMNTTAEILTKTISIESPTDITHTSVITTIPTIEQNDKLENAPWQGGEILIEKLQIKPISEYKVEEPTQEIKPQNTIPKPVQDTLIDNNVLDDEYLSSKIVGKLFNTFVLLENKDKVYIIDQHAAHERIL
ncbi:MAG: DNA mismatch repair endonuclease MutL, partial [Clostridia bacterium]|nr:DNA mismatch repair endonuclease MutL [Clostridia bacterium]